MYNKKLKIILTDKDLAKYHCPSEQYSFDLYVTHQPDVSTEALRYTHEIYWKA